MIYDQLSPRLQQFVDLLMGGHNRRSIGIAMNLKEPTLKRYLHIITLHYGIPPKGAFVPSVRLVYLRAKELGLIQ